MSLGDPDGSHPASGGRPDPVSPIAARDGGTDILRGLIRFVGTAKRFDDGTQALGGVDLAVSRGEFVTVVGPSGCGKTTLLRLAARLTAPTGGTVALGTDRVGYVFQDPTLLPWRDVRSNVALFAELRGLSRGERGRRVEEAIDLVGLGKFAGHRPRTLSGGMRMRVSLARSLTMEPDLFLLDEPFGSLDEMARERLNDDLLRLFVSRAFAALFVTHSVTEAVYLSTRVVVLSDRPGQIVGEFDVPFDYPRPAELRFDPSFARTAGTVSACLRESTHSPGAAP